MKKYYASGNVAAVIVGIVIALVGSTIPLTMFLILGFSSNVGFGGKEGGVINLSLLIPGCIFGTLFLGFGIYFIVRASLGLYHKSVALKGHKASGIVKDSYYTQGKNSVYSLSVLYKTDDGEDALLISNPGNEYSGYLSVGDEVPLYINGSYAYLDEEAIKNQASESFTAGSNKKTCPGCGNFVDKDAKFCQNCGYKF